MAEHDENHDGTAPDALEDNDRDYEVGYGRPPKHTQFKRGRSGNPNGRPKGVPNLKADLIRVLGAKVNIREGDKTRRVTKQLALLESLVAKGFKGDIRAVANALNLSIRVLGVDPVGSEDRPMDKADLERLLRARTRWLEAGTVYASVSFATVTVERPGGGGGA